MNTQPEPEVGTLEHCKRVLDEWQHEKEQKDKELADAVEMVRKGRDIIGEIAAYGDCQCDIPNGVTWCITCEAAWFSKECDAFLARHRK